MKEEDKVADLLSVEKMYRPTKEFVTLEDAKQTKRAKSVITKHGIPLVVGYKLREKIQIEYRDANNSLQAHNYT